MFSFDGVTKIISLSAGTTNVSVVELWSRYLDWLATGDNSKYLIAMTSLGGDSIDSSSGTAVPAYIFLQNDWKIRPDNSDHTLKVSNGILLVQGGGDPFTNPLDNHVVRINYQQPVQAITVSTGGGSGGGASSGELNSAKAEILAAIQSNLTVAQFLALK